MKNASRSSIRKDSSSSKNQTLKGKIIIYSLLIIYSLFVLVPFWIVFVSGLKTVQEAAQPVFTWWPKEGVSLLAYKRVFEDASLFLGFKNTLLFGIPPLFVGVFTSSMAAYGFAKMHWRGRDSLFQFLLLTMMLPGCVTMTASRLVYDTIGWIGTPLPLMIPGLFGGIGTVFFLRQYMKGIPDELIEAAKIDGMGQFTILISVILPLTAPAIFTQLVLGFLSTYNNYMGALLYLIDEDMYTLQIALRTLVSVYRFDVPRQMAASFLAMLPMLIIYFFAQKYILKGISMNSGLKG